MNKIVARIGAICLGMISGYIFKDSGFVNTIVGSMCIISAYELFRV